MSIAGGSAGVFVDAARTDNRTVAVIGQQPEVWNVTTPIPIPIPILILILILIPILVFPLQDVDLEYVAMACALDVAAPPSAGARLGSAAAKS
jgi:cellobiose-specific phosphotransferase system component IIC